VNGARDAAVERVTGLEPAQSAPEAMTPYKVLYWSGADLPDAVPSMCLDGSVEKYHERVRRTQELQRSKVCRGVCCLRDTHNCHGRCGGETPAGSVGSGAARAPGALHGRRLAGSRRLTAARVVRPRRGT
jgi:hypothetical protein